MVLMQNLQRPRNASPLEGPVSPLAPPLYQAGSAGNRLEVRERQESGEQVEAHPRASGAGAAATTSGSRSRVVEVQEGSAAVVEVAATPEPARLSLQSGNAIRLADAQQAAGGDGDPKQAAGPLSGPHQAAGLQPDMPSRPAASTAQVAKAGPGAVGTPLQVPALPAHTLVAASVDAVASSPVSTAKVQHAL